MYTWPLHASSKTSWFRCSLSDRASIKVFFPSKQILQEFLVHKCPVDPLCIKMDQHGSIYPDALPPTSCFYRSEFNRDVCGLKNRLVGLFSTLLSQMYSGMKTFSYWFILVPTLFYWGWYGCLWYMVLWLHQLLKWRSLLRFIAWSSGSIRYWTKFALHSTEPCHHLKIYNSRKNIFSNVTSCIMYVTELHKDSHIKLGICRAGAKELIGIFLQTFHFGWKIAILDVLERCH